MYPSEAIVSAGFEVAPVPWNGGRLDFKRRLMSSSGIDVCVASA
jgi:hypothetical protein